MSDGCSGCRGHRAGAARGVRHPAGNGSRWRGQAGVGKKERSLGGAQEARMSVVPRQRFQGPQAGGELQLGGMATPGFQATCWGTEASGWVRLSAVCPLSVHLN